MQRTGWIWVGLMVWAGACGGQALDGDASERSGQAGEAGEADRDLPEAGAGGQTSAGQPVQGGESGEGVVSDAELRAITEKGLTARDVEVDPAVLAGMSFTLDGSLCPSGAWSSGEGGAAPYWDVKDDPVGMATLHIRKGPGTTLEGVTYTAATGGEPLVEVTPMRRSGLGFVLSKVATCANTRYSFEDEWVSFHNVARLLHVVFVRGQGEAPLEAVMAATSHDGDALVSAARIDTQPPVYMVIKVAPGRDSVDDYYDGLNKDFVFSEPMPASTQVVIEEDGRQAAIDYRTSAGYVVGFRVNDLLGTGYAMSSSATDLAGHALPSGVMYPGINWGAVEARSRRTTTIVPTPPATTWAPPPRASAVGSEERWSTCHRSREPAPFCSVGQTAALLRSDSRAQPSTPSSRSTPD
jgi:hypothetical protein